MRFFTQNDVPSGLLLPSYASRISRIMPNGGAPLFAISGHAARTMAKSTEHGYWSKEMIYPKVTVDGNHLVSDTTFTVADSSQIIPGAILRFQKAYGGSEATHSTLAENLFVTSVPDATHIVVTRGFGGTTAAAVPDATVLVHIGNAHEHASNAPVSMAVKPVRHLNYTQIFRDAWDVSGTLAATKLENGYNSVSENRADCAALHAQSIEKNAFFGYRAQTSWNGRPLFLADGIEAMISRNAPSNLKEAASTTTYDQLESYLNPTLDYMTDAMQGNVRTIFCGGTAKQVINNIGRNSGTFQLRAGETEFGLRFTVFQTSRGTFNLIEHPLFNTNEDWKKMAVVLDLSSFDFAYLENRDTMHEEIYKGTGKDAIGGVLTTELTFQLQNPMACGIIYNLRAAG